MLVYVLQLEDNKYYIGKTRDIARRWKDHTEGIFGSAWTRKYKPIKIIEEMKDDGFLELALTLRYMKNYGIDNVRGAEYCMIKLTKKQLEIIQSHINAEDNLCFDCGGQHFVTNCPKNISIWGRMFCCFRNKKRNDTLTFGKYKGSSFEDVKEDHPDYCRWILLQNSNNRDFKNFQTWLKN